MAAPKNVSKNGKRFIRYERGSDFSDPRLAKVKQKKSWRFIKNFYHSEKLIPAGVVSPIEVK